MGSPIRLLFLAIWIYATVGPIWRALEAGEPQRAILPAVFLLFGVWAVLKSARKKQESEFEPTDANEPWEQSEWHEEAPRDEPDWD